MGGRRQSPPSSLQHCLPAMMSPYVMVGLIGASPSRSRHGTLTPVSLVRVHLPQPHGSRKPVPFASLLLSSRLLGRTSLAVHQVLLLIQRRRCLRLPVIQAHGRASADAGERVRFPQMALFKKNNIFNETEKRRGDPSADAMPCGWECPKKPSDKASGRDI